MQAQDKPILSNFLAVSCFLFCSILLAPGHSPRPNQDEEINPAMEPVGDFRSFAAANPTKAQELIAKVVEVTGVDDQQALYKAFDQSKKSHHSRDYNVTHAIGNISTYILL